MKFSIIVLIAAALSGCKSPSVDQSPYDYSSDEPIAVEIEEPSPPPPVATDIAQEMAESLPRKFTGTFKWTQRDGSGWASPDSFVTLYISSANATGDTVYFMGRHVYEPGRQSFHVVGQIDSLSYEVVMLESKAGEPVERLEPNLVAVAITDGSFKGSITEDLSAIEAVWTTSGRNMTGDLNLIVQRE